MKLIEMAFFGALLLAFLVAIVWRLGWRVGL